MSRWSSLFDEVMPQPPGSAEDIAELEAALSRPLSEGEIHEIIRAQWNPWPVTDPNRATWEPRDPRGWSMPSVPLPADYLDFLRWSDGPWVRKGEREFGFFTAREIRGYLLGYHFPECLPGAIPLGLDGGFIFAFFDTRGGPASEYPILAAHFSAMDFDGAVPVANTFLEFCSGTERIIDVLSPPDPKADAWHKKVDVILEKNPESLPALVSLRNHFELKMPASQLLALARTAPQVLLGGISNGRCEMLMNALPPALAPLIRIRESTQAPANP